MSEEKLEAKIDAKLHRINFIKQSSAFIALAGLLGLKPREVALYFQLFAINNRKGWRPWIMATNAYLQERTNISSFRSFDTARTALVEKGFILYVQGGKGMPSRYSLVKLYDPVPDYFADWLELATRFAKEHDEAMEYMLSCHDKNIKNAISNIKSRARSVEGSEKAVSSDCQKTVTGYEAFAGNTDSHSAGRTRVETSAQDSAKGTHISKDIKDLKKYINCAGVPRDALKPANCQRKGPADPDAMERHAKWFCYYAKGNTLSGHERSSLDYIESTYTTAAVEAAMQKADGKQKRSVGYVRSILDNALKKG